MIQGHWGMPFGCAPDATTSGLGPCEGGALFDDVAGLIERATTRTAHGKFDSRRGQNGLSAV